MIPCKNGFSFLVLFFHFISCFTQNVSDSILLKEVIVSTYRDEEIKQTSINIEAINIQKISGEGAFNLSDALSKTPGISQLSTGVSISKPVIRGLYGNRVLIMFSGLRFDNQQWQDEHGLGLSDIGISKIEIIKGPYSLLYGTEAVAGVINILEEGKPEIYTQQFDVGIKLNSNTLGETLNAGYKLNAGNKWMRFRIAAESQADYSDGNNERILNSRFDGYYLKASVGFKKNNWVSENNFNASLNRFGFIFSDVYEFFDTADKRWSRNFPGPHHIVILNVLSSQNTIHLNNSVLKINVGFQSNQRLEDEGSSISLNMHLITGEYTAKWSKMINEKNEIVFAQLSSIEKNTNYGKRKIIPDAWMAETGISALFKHYFQHAVLESGAGFGTRYIKTLYTNGVNSEEKEILPFSVFRPYANVLLGMSLNPTEHWNIKLNSATGVRSPNLAELSSNGLHEGIYTYEIGDPNLRNESNLNLNADIEYSGNQFQYSLHGFYNYFLNYIYLSPTDEEWFGFPVYRYLQQNANLYGGEAEISYTISKNLNFETAYSGMIGKKIVAGNTSTDEYLPFIPAQKITPSLQYNMSNLKNLKQFYVFINTDFVLTKTFIADKETTTAAYQLLNAGAGCIVQSKYFPIEFSLAGNNLLDEAYYDHLSRLKPLGIMNIGMNITLQCKIIFTKQLKKNNKQ